MLLPSHSKVCYVAPHHNHCDLGMQWCHWCCHWYNVIPVLMLVVSLDTDPDVNGVTWQKKSCFTSFQLSWSKEFNGTIDNANANGITWPQKSCYPSFQLSWLKEYSGAIDNAVGMTRHRCQCQQHQKTKMSHKHICIYIYLYRFIVPVSQETEIIDVIW